MRSYIVTFYRKSEGKDEKNTYLGSIEIDDSGVNQHFSLCAKAFRQAPPKCIVANIVRIERA